MTLRALELFCGIGGFSTAVAGGNIRIVGALDQSPAALEVYRLNFPGHPSFQMNLEKITAADLMKWEADFWWLSPPCQPYGVRGDRKDLDDPRARSLARLLTVLPEIPQKNLPDHMALENVAGFSDSEARRRLLDFLSSRNYRFQERLLCPTELGVPSRRPRYYLAASRGPLLPPQKADSPKLPLSHYLDPIQPDEIPGELQVSSEIVEKFGPGLRILEGYDPQGYTTCFTAGYGKSIVHAGSYLQCGNAVRRFSPREVARLLHFPPNFRFPETLPLRKRWHLLGNSLSVAAVKEILKAFPEFYFRDTEGFPLT